MREIRTRRRTTEETRSVFSFPYRQNTTLRRVPASRMKRMASQKAPKCAPHPTKSAIAFNRFHRIFRAGWRKSAGRTQPGRDRELVASEQGEREDLAATPDHAETPNRDSNSLFNSPNSRSHAERRAFTTISTPRGRSGHAARNISLVRRRIRFLLTATPSLRGVVKPTRL